MEKTSAGARFEALGEEEFKGLPANLKWGLLLNWAKSGRVEQTLAAAPLCPAVRRAYSAVEYAEALFESLALVGGPEEIKAASDRAKAERSEMEQKGRTNPFDFGAFAALAIEKGRPEAALAFIEAAEKLDGVLNDGAIRRTTLSAAAAAERWDLAEATLRKWPAALRACFCERTGSMRMAADLCGDDEQKQRAAWPAAAKLIELAKKTGADPLKLIPDETQDALFFSAGSTAREGSLAALGAPAREKRIKELCESRYGGAYQTLTRAIGCADEALIQSVAKKINLEKLDGELAERGPSGGSALMPAIKAGDAKTLRLLLSQADAARPGLASDLLSRGFWVWNSETNSSRRKKGDALALCVAEGQLECAQEILRSYPEIDRAYAKAAVKYLSQVGEDANAGGAISTWESLILNESALAAPAEPAPSAAAPSRRRL